MFLARSLKRQKKIQSCWTKDGRMFIRELNEWGTDDPGRVVQLHSKEDLDKYIQTN